MGGQYAKDFYEIQSSQWRKSLFLLVILILFYLALLGFFIFGIALLLEFIFSGTPIFTEKMIVQLLILDLALAFFISFLHLYDAKKFGAKFIADRLQAAPPSSDDLYHLKYIHTVEEIRLACGLPHIEPLVLPSYAVNSMALIQADGTPAVFVTEGLLAEFTRNELQAVVAHEAAHIIRGDTFYMTLVCSLANFFERVRQMLEPDSGGMEEVYPTSSRRTAVIPAGLLLKLSSVIMFLLSTLISRQREILADATAVELSRNPRALARAIAKAHIKNSFVGDFNPTYSPLFLVPQRSSRIMEGFFSRLFNSHPPLLFRIKMLTDMMAAHPDNIFEELLSLEKVREQMRLIYSSPEKHRSAKTETPGKWKIPSEESRIWKIRNPGGKFEGPFAIEELLSHRYFTPLIRIQNTQEGIEASAGEFPQIQTAIRNLFRKKPVNPARQNICPRCRIHLKERIYEGVPVKICPECRGKLVDSARIGRIFARREIGFSQKLKEKAGDFKHNFIRNPFRPAKAHLGFKKEIFCPQCTTKMLVRPFNYNYFVPVDKCLTCGNIWFDTDELEILQILVETR